jgi:hypothetical protein
VDSKRSRTVAFVSLAISFVLTLGAVVALLSLGGCAAGRNDATGEIVLGFGVAKLTEGTNQAVSQLADTILPGSGAAIGALSLAIGGPIASLGLLWARSKANAAAAKAELATTQAAQLKIDAAFDEGHARATGIPAPATAGSGPTGGPFPGVFAAPPAVGANT